ncbi:MFS transporter [Candidatus Bathyarchaeota archaeon]|nr:MFS transporter [Candidatus Bathyarchaeota archaeon]
MITSDFFKRLDRRFKILLASIGLHTWSSSLPSQYSQLYAVALGANPVELGSLDSIGGVVSSIFSAPAGWLIDKHGVKNMLVLGLILSAFVAVIYGFALNWWMLIPAIILMRIGMMLIMPLTDIIIIGTTEPKNRAMAMGLSRTIWAVPSIFAPFTAAIVVSSFGGINVEGIRPLYFIQLMAFLLTVVFTIVMLEPLPIQRKEQQHTSKKLNLFNYYDEFLRSEKWLKHWLIAMTVLRLGGISMPFVPLWIVDIKGADPYLLGVLGTVSVAVSLLLQIPMGKLADTIGRKKVFLILRPFSYIGTLLLVWAPNTMALIAAGALGAMGLMVFGGGIGGISFIPFITMYWESFPAEKRGRLQGISGLLDFVGSFATILGGLLWQAGYMELVLLLPMLIDIIVLVPTFLIIPESLGRDS